ncbi:Battenin [Chionoecetes opilio]|nr:Battenin [Chionoecetes opilio]
MTALEYDAQSDTERNDAGHVYYEENEPQIVMGSYMFEPEYEVDEQVLAEPEVQQEDLALLQNMDCFWVILAHPERTKCRRPCLNYNTSSEEEEESMLPSSVPPPTLAFTQKLALLPSLMKYMIPVFLVYLAEYVINQGLLELIYFPGDVGWLDHHEQYRWYQVVYQAGVMVSRSSVNCVHIDHIWKTSVLQMINVVLFLTCAIYWWVKNIWLVFFLILWEGLLGGAAYVNTFYKVSQEIDGPHKEYAMSVTTLADSLGITVAGFIAIPIHNAICSLPVK